MKELLNVKRNRVILILLGIFILIIAYYGVYMTNQDKMDSIKLEMVDMKSHLEQLENFNSKKQFYLDETDRMDEEMKTIISKFPVDILPEDLVMYIKESEDDYDINITNAVFSEKLTFDDLGVAVVAGTESSTSEESSTTDDTTTEETTTSEDTTASEETATAEESTTTDATTTDELSATNPEGYKRTIYLTVQSSYTGLKDLIAHIIDGNDKMVIDTISSSYDVTTGELSSEVAINCYYMTGTGREYEGSSIPQEILGKTDIFNTQR
ncbi:hypothetical protein [Anaerosporobacter sp.]